MKSVQLYYHSKNVVDQIYRSVNGPLSDVTETEGTKLKTGFSLKAGIGKIAELLGLTASASGNVEKEKDKSKTTKIKETSEDRVLTIIKTYFSNDPSDISDFTTDSPQKTLYSFELPLGIDYKKHPETKQYGVFVFYKGEDFQITGFTSMENWISPTIVNTTTMSKVPLPAAGLVIPLTYDIVSSPPKINVQFVAIFNPSSIRKK